MREMRERACKCGFTAENNRDKFEIFKMNMGSVFGKNLPPRNTLRCATCKEVSVMEAVDKVSVNPCDIQAIVKLLQEIRNNSGYGDLKSNYASKRLLERFELYMTQKSFVDWKIEWEE